MIPMTTLDHSRCCYATFSSPTPRAPRRSPPALHPQLGPSPLSSSKMPSITLGSHCYSFPLFYFPGPSRHRASRYIPLINAAPQFPPARVQVFDVSHAVHFSASRSRAARAPTTEGGMLLPPVDTLLPEVVLAPLRVIGGEGRGPGRFCGPYDTAVARSRLIVSEFEGRRVQVRISTTSAAIDEPRPPLTG